MRLLLFTTPSRNPLRNIAVVNGQTAACCEPPHHSYSLFISKKKSNIYRKKSFDNLKPIWLRIPLELRSSHTLIPRFTSKHQNKLKIKNKNFIEEVKSYILKYLLTEFWHFKKYICAVEAELKRNGTNGLRAGPEFSFYQNSNSILIFAWICWSVLQVDCEEVQNLSIVDAVQLFEQ